MTINVLFHRDYRRFQGGHLKVRDYFDHFRAFEGYRPSIYFTPESAWDSRNPWFELKSECTDTYGYEGADYLFLAGHDWLALPPSFRSSPSKPIINLLQHVRHADPENPLSDYLAHPAIRLCVSEAVSSAVRRSGRCAEPVLTIPGGIDAKTVSRHSAAQRDIGILIVGIKRPDLARALDARLSDLSNVRTLDHAVARDDFLALLGRSQVAILLPGPTEGLYLPALEAMLLGVVVVCPDAVGNRSFCIDSETCLMPPCDLEPLEHAARTALGLRRDRRAQLVGAARSRAEEHDLARERAKFRRVLDDLPVLWKDMVARREQGGPTSPASVS